MCSCLCCDFDPLGVRENLAGRIWPFWAFEKIPQAEFGLFGRSRKSRRQNLDFLGVRENLAGRIWTFWAFEKIPQAFDLTPAAIAATPLPLGEGILVRLRSP